jgi:hypothetical protein
MHRRHYVSSNERAAIACMPLLISRQLPQRVRIALVLALGLSC